MKYWEDVVCSHEDGFRSDCFGCGFKFCKEHSFLAKEKDEAVASAVEAERAKWVFASEGVRKEMEVRFLQDKQNEQINPSKE